MSIHGDLWGRLSGLNSTPGFNAIEHSGDESHPVDKLGEAAQDGSRSQLTVVLEALLRLDQDGALKHITSEVVDERHELEQLLERRRQFEREHVDSHGRSDKMATD
mmetsp:Transcript_2794/g.3908  ORF Transcript_2794/g.3908 Transcript_2794/m.3908 type:complete len:106 (+) Transcript_2794:88-405(+)